MPKAFVGSSVPITLLLMFLLWPEGTQAATLVVNSTDDTADTKPGDGACAVGCDTCTLRAAIMEAEALGGADTIKFDPTVFKVPKTIALGRALPFINQDLTITGSGAPSLTIDANGTGGVFFINSGAVVTLSGLSITGGSANRPERNVGGGIYNEGTLTLTNVTIRGNTAWQGGGIYSVGALVLNSSTVSGNTAIGGPFSVGGGIFKRIGTAILNKSTVSGNTAAGGTNSTAGGIMNWTGTLILNNSTVSGNSAYYGGGIANASALALTLNNCTVAGNSASEGAGFRINGGTVTLKNTILDNGNNCSFVFLSTLVSLGHNLGACAAGSRVRLVSHCAPVWDLAGW